MILNLNLPKLILIGSAVALGYFLLNGFLLYYSVDISGIIGEVFRGIIELVTIPLLFFVPCSFLFSLYRVIFKKEDKKMFMVIGLLNLATILWMVYMTYYFD